MLFCTCHRLANTECCRSPDEGSKSRLEKSGNTLWKQQPRGPGSGGRSRVRRRLFQGRRWVLRRSGGSWERAWRSWRLSCRVLKVRSRSWISPKSHRRPHTDHLEQGLAGSDLHSEVSLWLKCDNGLEKKGVAGGRPTTEDTITTTEGKLGPGHWAQRDVNRSDRNLKRSRDGSWLLIRCGTWSQKTRQGKYPDFWLGQLGGSERTQEEKGLGAEDGKS